MDSKAKGRESRKFLKAARRTRRDSDNNSKHPANNDKKQGVGEKRALKDSGKSTGKHAKDSGGGEREKKKNRDSVACPMNSKALITVSSSSRFPTSTAKTCTDKQSAKKLTKEEILQQVMAQTTGMSKSFKIPKKKPAPAASDIKTPVHEKTMVVAAPIVGVGSSHVIGGRGTVANQKQVVSEPVKTVDSHVGKVVILPEDQPMESMECEDMEWETTVQEIKGFWAGSHFKREENEAARKTVALETMDVDMEGPTQLIIVPDTNVWIQGTKLISDLLEAKFDTYAYPTIVIPWMVLQELDSNKGKLGGSGGRSAINFIHKLLSSRHPRVKGQKASDAAQVVPGYDKIEDDSILQCAEQCQSPDTIVVLLTNDCNLRNKALVNNVKTCDARGGVKGIQKFLSISSNNNNEFESPSPFSPRPLSAADCNPLVIPVTPQTPKRPESNNPSSSTRNSSKRLHSPRRGSELKRTKVNFPELLSSITPLTAFKDVLKLTEETLSYIIEKKMKEDYGDPDWLNAVKIPPPWTLKAAVNCIVKHWFAVFTEVFGKRDSVAKKLLKSIQDYDGGKRGQQIEEELIENILGLFAASEFASCDLFKKDPQVEICRHSLLGYLQRLKSGS